MEGRRDARSNSQRGEPSSVSVAILETLLSSSVGTWSCFSTLVWNPHIPVGCTSYGVFRVPLIQVKSESLVSPMTVRYHPSLSQYTPTITGKVWYGGLNHDHQHPRPGGTIVNLPCYSNAHVSDDGNQTLSRKKNDDCWCSNPSTSLK